MPRSNIMDLGHKRSIVDTAPHVNELTIGLVAVARITILQPFANTMERIRLNGRAWLFMMLRNCGICCTQTVVQGVVWRRPRIKVRGYCGISGEWGVRCRC